MDSESWTALSYTLSKSQAVECQQCVKKESSPPTPITGYPAESPWKWDLAFQKHAANMYLWFPSTNDSYSIRDCKELLRIVNRFTNLRTLRLDFLNVGAGYEDNWDEDKDLMHELQSTFWKSVKKLQDPARPAGALRKIVLTGLPIHDSSLYIVKQYTRLLAPNGRIGVGWGAKGKRTSCLVLIESGRLPNERIWNFCGRRCRRWEIGS